MNYIDLEKLIAKIVELRKELPDTIEHLNDEESGFARGQQYELTAIEAEILCLQQEQPEVDLEKELDSLITPELKKYKALPSMMDVAKHFYELGLNARKEE